MIYIQFFFTVQHIVDVIFNGNFVSKNSFSFDLLSSISETLYHTESQDNVFSSIKN